MSISQFYFNIYYNDILPILISLRWQDIIDITFNSYILFRLYVIFRGTNAFQVLTGIGFLWLFQRIAIHLGLVITSWAIQGIIAMAALIIIIVFRNEIPTVFQGKNLKNMLWGFPQQTFRTPIEIIVEAVHEMAQKHCGALIVFPGKEDLKDVVQGGIGWRGLISKEMIISIFSHDTPVHDGAIIIQDDQVTEVSVILPLSRSKDLPSYYGTRHRAALGLAEAKDALIITVSEERGDIVVARESKMVKVMDKKVLEGILQDHYGIFDPTVKTVKKQRLWKKRNAQWIYDRSKNKMIPKGNWKEKLKLAFTALISFIIISTIWFSLTRGLDTLITLDVPVEYLNRDPIMDIVDLSVDNKVRLHLSAPEGLIKSIRPEDIRVRIDMNKAVLGKNVMPINIKNISLPHGVILSKVDPPFVVVTLDVPTTKEVPIQVDWVGKFTESHIMTEIVLEPEMVWVTGGSITLADLTTIYTEQVSLNQLDISGEIVVGLNYDKTKFSLDSGQSETVTILYKSEKRKE